jgi:hypothetical protein
MRHRVRRLVNERLDLVLGVPALGIYLLMLWAYGDQVG